MAGTNGVSFLSARWMRILLWCCVLYLTFLIFHFSAEDAETSNATSDQLVRVVVQVTHPDYDRLPVARQKSIWKGVSFYVRKSAHFLEYMALGFILRLLMASYSIRFGALWAWLGGTFYAATDELHQIFSSGRAGMWQDVLLDSAGVFFGGLVALVLMAIVRWLLRRRASHLIDAERPAD